MINTQHFQNLLGNTLENILATLSSIFFIICEKVQAKNGNILQNITQYFMSNRRFLKLYLIMALLVVASLKCIFYPTVFKNRMIHISLTYIKGTEAARL